MTRSVCVLAVLLGVGCSSHEAHTSLAASPSSTTATAEAPLPGPVVEDYDFSCYGRDKEVMAKVGAALHPNTILQLSNRRFAYLRDTPAGYDIFDNPENWCMGGSGVDGNVTHVTTVGVRAVQAVEVVSCGRVAITPALFASSPHLDPGPGSSCWSLAGVPKRGLS